MTAEEMFRQSVVSLEVNEAFTEAVLLMQDASRLCFYHRVGERWAKAVDADEVGPLPASPAACGCYSPGSGLGTISKIGILQYQ